MIKTKLQKLLIKQDSIEKELGELKENLKIQEVKSQIDEKGNINIIDIAEKIRENERRFNRIKTEINLELKKIEHSRNFKNNVISGLGIALALSLATTSGLLAETWINGLARDSLIKFISSLIGLSVIVVIFIFVSWNKK